MNLHTERATAREESRAHDESSRDFLAENEDSDVSFFYKDKSVEDVLNTFREKWQKELQVPRKKSSRTDRVEPQTDDFENEAKSLFLKGEELEKTGKMYEAIQFYRKAVQLVPDIEFRLNLSTKSHIPIRELTVTEKENEIEENDKSDDDRDDDSDDDDDDEDEEIKEGELLQRIQKKVGKLSTLCLPKVEQKTTHISALPMEMILYILRWVVSSDLDLRSLEMFSMVCRGFYLCARDSEIWKLACLKIWGLNCESSSYNYLSWRHMFIERSRLQFNGCYICKTTYFRYGENSFQDKFYRPWHLVSYYRYLRFFPEGTVLLLTTAEEPSQCVGQMKYRNARSPILKGYYRLKDDKVTLIISRKDNKPYQGFKKNKRRGDNLHESAEQTSHMELQILGSRKKRHVQLTWTHYSVFTRNPKGDESTCNFDLVANKFPPFWFSRVKSYTSESEFPLE